MAGAEVRKRSLILEIDPSRAVSGSKRYTSAIERAGRASVRATKSIDRADRALDKLGLNSNIAARGLAKIGGGFAAIRAAQGAVSVISSFQETMAQVGAVTSRAGESVADAQARFEKLSAAAKQAGATTRFSATQAAEGLLFLGRAGFDADQAVAALAPSLNLAAAGALDLGTSADIASNVVSQFNLRAEETTRVADVLITTSNRANTSVLQLGEAMKFAGPLASALGVSLEETAAAAGVLGDSGIQATLAGTNLRGILVRLLKPSTEAKSALKELGLTLDEVNPEKVGLAGAFRALADAQLDSTSAAAIFGKLNVTAGLALTANVAKVEQLTEANDKSTDAAQRQAAVVEDTLGGALRRFRAAVEGAALATGERGFSGAVRSAVEVSAEFVRVLFNVEGAASTASPQMAALAGAVNGLTQAFLLLVGARIARGVVTVLANTKAVASAAILAAQAKQRLAIATNILAAGHTREAAAAAAAAARMGVLRKVTIGLFALMRAHPIGLVITALGAAGAAMGFFQTKTRQATEAIIKQDKAFVDLQETFKRIREVEKLIDLSAPLGKTGSEIENLTKRIGVAEEAFLAFSSAVEEGSFADGRKFGEQFLSQLGLTKAELRDLGIVFDQNNPKYFSAQEVIKILADRFQRLQLELQGAIEDQETFDQSLRGTVGTAVEASGAVDRFVLSLQAEAAAAGLSAKNQDKYRAVLEALRVAKENDETVTLRQLFAINAAIDKQAALEARTKQSVQSISDALKQHDFRRDIAQEIGRGFQDAVFSAESARDAISGIVSQISATIFEAFVTRRLVDAIAGSFQTPKPQPTSGPFSFLTGLFRSANGNIFGRQHGSAPRKLANGGFIQRSMDTLHTADGPTTIGERGPEAVVPLARDSRGVLGLADNRSGGGGRTVQLVQHINIHARDADSFKRSRRSVQRELANSSRRALGQYGAAS